MSGRGGAGNIQAVQQEKARVANDLESGPNNGAQHDPIIAEVKSNDQQYAHSGRGGAGNYYSPKELNESGNFSSGNKMASKATESAASAQPVRKYGRGGAGNYEFSGAAIAQTTAQAQADEAGKRAKLQDVIEKDVGEKLAFPSKAKLPGAEPY